MKISSGLLAIAVIGGLAVPAYCGPAASIPVSPSAQSVDLQSTGTVTVNLTVKITSDIDDTIICRASVNRSGYVHPVYRYDSYGHYVKARKINKSLAKCTITFKYLWSMADSAQNYSVSYQARSDSVFLMDSDFFSVSESEAIPTLINGRSYSFDYDLVL